MSINPSRAQARLTKTLAAITDLESKIKKNTDEQEVLKKDYNAILESINSLNAKKRAMVQAKELAVLHLAHWDGKQGQADYPAQEIDDDKNQIKAADDSIVEYDKDLLAFDMALKTECESINPRVIELDAEEHNLQGELTHILLAKDNQEAALARVEASYPAKLKRHLAKCKRFGWADARLKSGKKK
jgi:chromosome segregation ATPase